MMKTFPHYDTCLWENCKVPFINTSNINASLYDVRIVIIKNCATGHCGLKWNKSKIDQDTLLKHYVVLSS